MLIVSNNPNPTPPLSVLVELLRDGKDVQVPAESSDAVREYASLAGQLGVGFTNQTPFEAPDFPPAYRLKFNTANPVTYIFDVDGTLANSDHRDPYDESLVHKDTLIRPVGEVFWSLFAAGFHIIVLSGRKNTSYKQTKEWIADRTGVPVNGFGLVMRGALDNRPDWLVKFEMLRSLQESDVNVLGVFDDRNSVLRMWQTAGVHVFDVSQGKGEF